LTILIFEFSSFTEDEFEFETEASQDNDFIIDIDGYPRPGDHEADSSQNVPHRLTYSLCGPGTGRVCPYIGPTCQSFDSWKHCRDEHPFSHPLVCKQFWAETTHMLFQTSIWVFHSHHDLRLLLNSKQACVPRIQKMIINSPNTETLVIFCSKWEQALTWRLMRRLENLKDVSIYVYVKFDRNEMRTRRDLLNDQLWVKAKLPLIIRSFQQHKLISDLTIVCIGARDDYKPYLKPLENALCSLFLEHVPLGQSSLRRERTRIDEETKCKAASLSCQSLQHGSMEG
jgi:hypothetical protein